MPVPPMWWGILTLFAYPFCWLHDVLKKASCNHKEWVEFKGDGRIYDKMCKRCHMLVPRK